MKTLEQLTADVEREIDTDTEGLSAYLTAEQIVVEVVNAIAPKVDAVLLSILQAHPELARLQVTDTLENNEAVQDASTVSEMLYLAVYDFLWLAGLRHCRDKHAMADAPFDLDPTYADEDISTDTES